MNSTDGWAYLSSVSFSPDSKSLLVGDYYGYRVLTFAVDALETPGQLDPDPALAPFPLPLLAIFSLTAQFPSVAQLPLAEQTVALCQTPVEMPLSAPEPSSAA